MPVLGLLLEPLDVLFFRDSRPFGEGDYGRSRLPLPQTLAGMVRTHLMHAEGRNPWELHGRHDPAVPREQWPWFARVRCRGPWLHVGQEEHLLPEDLRGIRAGPLVPAPADLVRLGKEREAELDRLRPLAEEDVPPGWRAEPAGLRPLWRTGKEKVEPTSGFLDVDGLQAYLRGEVPRRARLHALDTLLVEEERIGISVDPQTGTAVEGRIYSAAFLRLRPGVCFYAEVEIPDDAPLPVEELFPKDGVALPWGGEGRRVRVRRTSPFPWGDLVPADPGPQSLSLLITPGVFTRRWLPPERGTLVAAAVPKPLPVSGWDLAGEDESGERPRPTRWAVPAGAVYFWRRGRHAPERPNGAVPDSLADRPQDRDTGWGLALPGRWTFHELTHGGSR